VIAMNPSCFGENNGEIDANPVGIVGGQGPFEYSLNGSAFGGNSLFTNLGPGTYEVTVRDANGCEIDTTVTINEPSEVTITAKEDQFKEAGEDIDADTLVLQVLGVDQNQADSIVWYDNETGERLGVWPNVPSLDSLIRTRILRVELWDNGCFDSDLITIFVKFTKRVFIPNVITPGGSGPDQNNFLTIHANRDRIENINFLRVYDRWGELIYSSNDIPYDQKLGRSLTGWDGTFNGELLNPGVFVYHTQIEFFGGSTEDFAGDVTLLLTTP